MTGEEGSLHKAEGRGWSVSRHRATRHRVVYMCVFGSKASWAVQAMAQG